MPAIEVLLEVPPAIVKGLTDGTLERVGGVIREVGNKQVVAWLREGGKIASNPDILTKLLQATGGVGSVATGILNTAVSAHSHHLIMRALAQQGLMLGTLGVLNIAISGCNLLVMINRFQALNQRINEIYERTAEEFNRDRQIHLESTLANCRDMVEAEGDSYRRDAPRLNQDLDKAKRHILRDVDDLNKNSQLHMVQDYLLLAMQVDISRIRCFLEIDEHELARDRLKECLKDYQNRTREFVHKMLGAHHARYFHKSISDEDLERYIRIEGWLNHGKDDVLMDVIKKYRRDFWNQDAIQDIIPGRSLPGRPSEEPIQHLVALTQAEILIENLRRLQGFERELDAIERLGLMEWEALTDKAAVNIEEHNDYVLLVDTDVLKRLSA